MGVLDGVWHLLNFFGPSVGLGLLATLLAKLLWWRDLRSVSPWRMAAWAVSGCALVSIGGLLWTGHDGKMVTYAAMIMACAVSLWWAGWGARRA